MDDRYIEMQPASRGEGVDEHLVVLLPRVKGRRGTRSYESVSLYAAPPRVVAGDDEHPREVVIREPYLVLGDEPVGVVTFVELSIGAVGEGGRELHARDVFLDMALPHKVGFGM